MAFALIIRLLGRAGVSAQRRIALVIVIGAVSAAETCPLRAEQKQSTADAERSAINRILATAETAPGIVNDGVRVSPRSWGEAMMQGRDASEKGDYDRAIALMNSLLRQRLSKRQAAIALTNRGSSYGAKGDLNRAMQDYDQALRFDPAYPGGYLARGILWGKKGELTEAKQDFDEVITLDPRSARAHFLRAGVFIGWHQSREALTDLNQAIQLDPKLVEAYAIRALVYLRGGDNKKATENASRSLGLSPNRNAYLVRANAYVRTNRLADANKDLATARSLKGKEREQTMALNDIAWMRATCQEVKMRSGPEAMKLASEACERMHWKDWHTLDTLAAACAEVGDFDSAVRHEQKAIELTENAPPPSLPEMNERLALYQQHQPYRDPLKL